MRYFAALIIALLPVMFGVGSTAAETDWYASQTVSWSLLGTAPYDDPLAVLGKPTVYFKDPGAGGETWACSMVVSSWNLDPVGNKIITTVNPGGHITVKFDTPIEDDPENWYGLDFIVFGNSAFNATNEEYLTPDTDVEQCFIDGAGLGRWEPAVVSVAQYAGGPWYDFSLPTDPRADSFAPLQAFAWDNINHTWGAPLDAKKPVDPALEPADFANLSVAQAIDLYKGSAGGAAFDISRFPLSVNAKGRKWVQYVKVNGSRGEVDAFARVGHAMAPATAHEAKSVADDEPVIVSDLVVSACAEELGDCCYAQAGSRACGIKLKGRALGRDQKITVHGVMTTDGVERAIEVTAVEDHGTGECKVIGAGNRELSGNANIHGLLVRTWGRVVSVYPATRSWLVDDGSGSPVKCLAPVDEGFQLPVENSVAVVTGPCALESDSQGHAVPVIRLRNQNDLN